MISGIAQFTATQLTQNLGNASPVSFSQKPISDIGDYLERAENSGLSNALSAQINPAGQNLSVPTPNALEAASLSPSVNLSPSTQLQVTDFVNVSSNAFPTEAPPQAETSPPTSNSGNTTPAYTTDNSVSNSSSDSTTPSSAVPAYQSTPTDIYNSVASASSSILRGSSVNTSV